MSGQQDLQDGTWAHAGAFTGTVVMSPGTKGADV